MSKHTPGPWIKTETDDSIFFLSESNNGSYVASLEKQLSDGINRRAQANANLIAAAPEMLNVLGEVRRNWEMFDADEIAPEEKRLLDMVTEVLNKARGES